MTCFQEQPYLCNQSTLQGEGLLCQGLVMLQAGMNASIIRLKDLQETHPEHVSFLNAQHTKTGKICVQDTWLAPSTSRTA